MNSELWLNKFAPKTLGDFKTHSDNIKKIIAWITTYSTPKPERKLLLLSGPPGCGKTQLAKTTANACNVDSVFINCSGDRDFDTLSEKINPYVISGSIYDSRVVLILDEIDGMRKFKSTDTFFNFLSNVIKITPNPIIATCNDSYKLPSQFISDNCIELKFRRPYDSTVRNILMDISIKEGFKLTTDEIDKLIIKGDIRASISSLQIYCMSGYTIPQIERDRNIFFYTNSCLTHKTYIHKGKNFADFLKELLSYIEENGNIRITGIDRYYFYKLLNEASYLLSHYRTEEARNIISKISYAISYPQDPEIYIKTQRPSFLSKLALTKQLRANIKSLSLKICADYNISSKDFYEFIFPVMQVYAIADIGYARYITQKYLLSKEEIALLIDSSMGDPRITKCLIPDRTLTSKLNIPEKPEAKAETNNLQDMLA